MATEKKPIPPSVFPLCLSAASPVGTDPVFSLHLVVDPMRDTVNGIAEMRQKTLPPFERFNVSGTIHEILWGAEVSHVIALKGEYHVPFPPPAIGELTVPFFATIVLNSKWDGRGTFRYGRNRVEQAIVTHIDCFPAK